jgi:hypothetical protein
MDEAMNCEEKVAIVINDGEQEMETSKPFPDCKERYVDWTDGARKA